MVLFIAHGREYRELDVGPISDDQRLAIEATLNALLVEGVTWCWA